MTYSFMTSKESQNSNLECMLNLMHFTMLSPLYKIS